MADEVDVLQSTLNVLKDNWVQAHTGSAVPTFIKITDKKRLDFMPNTSYVIAQRNATNIQPAGIGEANKHDFDNFDIDVRVMGKNREQHFLNVLKEIKRIYDEKKVNPITAIPETHILDYDGTGQDLSNKMFNVFRKLIPTQLKRYNITRS